MKKQVTKAILLILAFLLVVTFFASVTIVKAGTVGVVSTFGAVNDVPLTAGFHFRTPFVTKVTKIDIKTQKAEADCNAASKDLQTISTSVAVNYHISPTAAPTLYKTVGMNYEAILIVPAIQESVKAVTAQYSAEELITNRQEVSNAISEKLANKISSYGLTIELFNITNLDFSATFNEAIEAKQTAEQNALKAQQDLARIKIEAEQTLTKAEAQANANKIIAESITQPLIDMKLAEARLQHGWVTVNGGTAIVDTTGSN